jgi:hypothetical protein
MGRKSRVVIKFLVRFFCEENKLIITCNFLLAFACKFILWINLSKFSDR